MYANKSVKAAKPRLIKIITALLTAAGILILPVYGSNGTAFAQGGLTFYTSYPGVTAKAGETVEFPLSLENKSGSFTDVALSVKSIPKDWEGYFEGMGKTISRVLVKGGSSETADFKVKIPADTKEGSYQVVISAGAAGLNETLTLDLKVSSKADSRGKLETQYPMLQGPGGASFKFRVTLTNTGGKDQSYSLNAKAPEGWEVSFSPSYDSKQIASISLQQGKNQDLDIDVKPPKSAKAGKYNIPVAAVSADETLAAELQVIITGTYGIDLSTPTGRLNVDAYAGNESPVTLKVANKGSADLKEITFSSTEPPNWSVTFKPDKIGLLGAGQSQEVKAYIKPSPRAIAGDYVVKLTASANEASGDAEFRVSVKTPTTWGIVGIIIILVLVGGLYWIFKVYGRR